MHKVNLVLESAQVDYRPTMINLTHVINIVTKELMGTINAVSRVREALGDNATSTKRPALPSGNASTTTTATAAAAAAGAGNPSAASGAPPESAGDAVGAAEGGGGANQGTGEGGGGEREGGGAAAAADPVPMSQVPAGVQIFVVSSKRNTAVGSLGVSFSRFFPVGRDSRWQSAVAFSSTCIRIASWRQSIGTRSGGNETVLWAKTTV